MSRLDQYFEATNNITTSHNIHVVTMEYDHISQQLVYLPITLSINLVKYRKFTCANPHCSYCHNKDHWGRHPRVYCCQAAKADHIENSLMEV